MPRDDVCLHERLAAIDNWWSSATSANVGGDFFEFVAIGKQVGALSPEIQVKRGTP